MMGFIGALPGAVSQGLIWGIMAIGVYITYKILDFPDLSVDGTFPMGAALTSCSGPTGVPGSASSFAGCFHHLSRFFGLLSGIAV